MVETVAGVLVRTLQESGVDVVFGLPGGENVEVVEALRQAGIRFVLVHNEASAVFMADAAARLTGKPGVCLSTLGPGAANSVAGVAHVFLDRTPVLIITAQVPDRLRPHHTHQFLDLKALFTPITKGSFAVQPNRVRETVHQAIELATTGRPGPVHLQLSNEVASQPTAGGPPVPEALPGAARAAQSLVDARQLLAGACRPLIVVGLGLEPERPYTALRELTEAACAPVISTPKGKGSLPDDHPLAAGTIGLTRTDPAYEILDEADCILAVGFDVVELVKPWCQPAPLIWLAPWSNEDPSLPARTEFVGPMQPVLRQLGGATSSVAPDWGQARVARFRERLSRRFLPLPAPNRMLPQSVLEAVRQAVPRDVVLTTDVGAHKILTSLTWPTYTPNSFLVSNGLSCMGFGLPAAIGASLASPGRPVVCITGDGGMAMVIGELGVLARLGLPVIVVIMNDGALDLIRSQQAHAGKPIYGTEFVNPDFVRVAGAYRLGAWRVSSRDQCTEVVARAVATGRPAIIEALIDPVGYATALVPATQGI